MVNKGRKRGTVRFSVCPGDEVKRVELAGDFTEWQIRPMRRQKNGDHVAVVPLTDGTHEYKFLFDNEWSTDPDNEVWAMTPHGMVNSVAVVG